MYEEEYDFFEDLDDDAAPRQSRSQPIRDAWKHAMRSTDLGEISDTLNALSCALLETEKQIELYEKVPSQRHAGQTERWYAAAISVKYHYQVMYRTLDGRRYGIKGKAAERKVAEKIRLEYRLEVIKARAKVLTVRCEMNRSKDEGRRFISLLAEKKILPKDVCLALWAEVRNGYVSKSEDAYKKALEEWQIKLAEAKNALRSLNDSLH